MLKENIYLLQSKPVANTVNAAFATIFTLVCKYSSKCGIYHVCYRFALVKRNLFYTLFTKLKSSSSKGCKQRKTPTQQYVQDMTKILHDAENCTFGANGFLQFRKKLVTKPLYFDRAPFSNRTACLQTSFVIFELNLLLKL